MRTFQQVICTPIYMGLFLLFSSVLEKLKSPLTCHCLKHMVTYVFDSTVLYKVQYQKKNTNGNPTNR